MAPLSAESNSCGVINMEGGQNQGEAAVQQDKNKFEK